MKTEEHYQMFNALKPNDLHVPTPSHISWMSPFPKGFGGVILLKFQ